MSGCARACTPSWAAANQRCTTPAASWTICEEHGIGDWDLAFAHEALARAHAVVGDRAASQEALGRAHTAAEDIADPEDRELLDADLKTIPGAQPV